MSILNDWRNGPWANPTMSGLLIVVATALSLSQGVNPFGSGHGGIGSTTETPAALLASDLVMAAAAVVAGGPILITALHALAVRNISIDLLVSIAAIGAIIIGEYWEAAAVTFLFAIGHALESATMNKTRSSLADLVAVAPAVAVVLRDGQQVEVPAIAVQPEETVLVKNGSKVPVDGVVIDGTGAVDESSITGESIPADKTTGDQVFAGTVSAGGFLQVRATRIGADTKLAHIIHRVEEAQDTKARTQSFMEKFSAWYTPSIILLAFIAGVVTGDVVLALTLLVIGCPGALVISIPVAIVAGIGIGAKSGILIKGGEFLETSARISAVALDKTGTLTEGQPHLTDVTVLEPGMSRADVLQWTAQAEAGSEHPLAQAIVDAARAEGVAVDGLPSHTEPVPGKGIVALIDGRRVAVGNMPLMVAEGITSDLATGEVERLSAHGRTPMVVLLDRRVIGVIGVADRIRADAAAMVADLHAAGAKKVAMLTGDTLRVGHAVASAVGLEEVHAHLLPEDKLRIVRQWQAEGHTVAMVGDGVNDAPALAAADIGVAMGAAGTGVAIETADIALMNDDLRKLPQAIRLARSTIRVMKQNIAIALLTVVALLAGVFAGGVTMSIGMLIHEGSVLLVIANAMRLLRHQNGRGEAVDRQPVSLPDLLESRPV